MRSIASVHADHRVSDRDAYRAAVVASAGWAAATDGLATVGLVPTAPVTGFGYIEVAAARDPRCLATARRAALRRQRRRRRASRIPIGGVQGEAVSRLAQDYVEDGRHLWNLGLFSWTARRFRAELDAADPELAATIDRVVDARLAGDEALATSIYAALSGSSPSNPSSSNGRSGSRSSRRPLAGPTWVLARRRSIPGSRRRR